MNELILEDQPLEVLTELAKGMHEECRDVLDMVIKNEKRLAHFGRVLAACRAKVPHGQWSQWVQETFAGSITLRTAQRWIIEAVEPAKADAVRAKDREAKAAKSNASDLSHLKPSVQVIEPGLKEEPKTNTKHTAENAKAKEAERPAPRPIAVQAELVQATEPQTIPQIGDPYPVEIEEKTLSDFSIREIGEYLKESAEEPKERAKWLRKLADELDPPTPKPSRAAFTPPSIDQVREYVHSINGKTDPETFCDFYTSKDWLVGKVKMKDWKAAVRTWEKGRDNKQGASALRGDEW